jgi:hypothetical protein
MKLKRVADNFILKLCESIDAHITNKWEINQTMILSNYSAVETPSLFQKNKKKPSPSTLSCAFTIWVLSAAKTI